MDGGVSSFASPSSAFDIPGPSTSTFHFDLDHSFSLDLLCSAVVNTAQFAFRRGHLSQLFPRVQSKN